MEKARKQVQQSCRQTGTRHNQGRRKISVNFTTNLTSISTLRRTNHAIFAASVTLLRHLHDGVDAITHTVVAIFDDLEVLESSMDMRAKSAACAAVGRAGASISKVNDSALAIQRQTWGRKSRDAGDYLAAVLLNASDQATWISAVDKMMGSIKFKNPGMLRIVRLRGGPSTHSVLLVAPSYAELITFMERIEASNEFATMRSASDSSVVGTTIYQVANVWNP